MIFRFSIKFLKFWAPYSPVLEEIEVGGLEIQKFGFLGHPLILIEFDSFELITQFAALPIYTFPLYSSQKMEIWENLKIKKVFFLNRLTQNSKHKNSRLHILKQVLYSDSS